VEIIRFVADARAEFSPSGSDFDPVAAETMIKSVLGRACAGSVDTHTLVEVEMVLIRKVLKDANPMSDQLDEFLAEAEGVATEWAEFEDK
jgi:recombinational DNA repair protein RecT